LIPNLSALTAPFTDLLKPYSRYTWNESAQSAFDALKAATLNYATLSAPLPNAKFIVSTDASAEAVGYVIEQTDNDDQRRIVAMGGAKLDKHQRRYNIHEKELLALRVTLQKEKALLDGRQIEWRTDSKTAASIRTTPLAGKSPAMRAFAADVIGLPITIVHIRSRQNPVADAVSRIRHQFDEQPSISVLEQPSASSSTSPNAPATPPAPAPSASSSSSELPPPFEVPPPLPTVPPAAARSASFVPRSRESTPPTPATSQPTSTSVSPAIKVDRPLPPTPPSVVPRGEPILPTPIVLSPLPTVPTTLSSQSSTLSSSSSSSSSSSTSTSSEAPTSTTTATSTTSTTSAWIDDTDQLAPSTDDPKSTNIRRLITAQRNDPSLQPYFDAVAGKFVPPHIHAVKPCIAPNGLLMRRIEGDESQTAVIVPESFRREFLAAAHDGSDATHGGVRATTTLLKQSGWWPSMNDDITRYVQSCLVCQSSRSVPPDSRMGKPPTDLRRFERLHMDFCPLPLSFDGFSGVYVIVDAATGYIELTPAKAHDAEHACRAVKLWIDRFGAPAECVVDCGRELIGTAMHELAKSQGFTLSPNSPYNHQSNGIVERKMGPIKDAFLRSARLDIAKWSTFISDVARQINKAPSRSRADYSAFELVFGDMPNLAIRARHGLFPSNRVVPPADDSAASASYIKSVGDSVATMIATANEQRAKVQQQNAEQFERIGKPRDLEIGKFVFLSNSGTQTTSIQNRQTQSGPFKIIELNDLQKRAILERPDGVRMTTPVSYNRLQIVDTDRVVSPQPTFGEPGVIAWSGKHDTSLLLDADRAAVAKHADKLDQQRQAEAAAAADAAAKAAARHARADAIRESERAFRAKLAQDRLQQQQDAAQRELRMRTAVVPRDAIPTQRLKLAGPGHLLHFKLDDNPKGIFINSSHPDFNYFDKRFNDHQRATRTASQQAARHDRLLRRNSARPSAS
jgi:hypothetical protein